jgi:hypothetical protein
MAEMTDAELVSWIENEEGQALGFHSGDLSRERELALDYYHGKIDVQAPEGRSDVVETDVRDTVDGMLPDLLDVFLSSDDVVKFEPQGVEDEAGAQQATDAVNYVFYRQNNGALVMYEVCKSALLEKVGVFKFYHEKYATPTIERYDGLNEAEFQLLVNQPGVQVLEHSAAPDPSMQGMSLHDVRIRVVDPNGKICVHGVPSEEFRVCVDHNSISLRDVRFFQHARPLTVSAIRAMGIDVNPDEPTDIDTTFSPEYRARRRFNEEVTPGYPDNSDPSQKLLLVSECSALVDRDGDGYAERRRIVKIGKTIYEDDYADHVPFSAICPTPMPYRFFGLSAADNAMTSQKTKSIIKRGMLDSLYFALNPRIGVMESMANLDDLLVSRPGGVVRFKTNPNMAWSPMEHRFVGQQAFPMLEYEDAAKENRTGFTRYSQGMDANALNKTATGISIISSASAKRAKLIARMFAETGIKDMMQGIKHLLKATRSGKPIAMRLRGQWVDVDPREWKTQWDMTVNVGLGTNDKTTQAAHLGQIMGVQKEMRMAGMSHIVTDQNLYNSAKRLQETAGYKQEGEFFTPPSEQNPPPQPQPPVEVITKQMEQQSAQQKNESAERIKQMELMSGQAVTKMQQDTSLEVARINAAAELEKTRMVQEAEAAREVFKAGNERDLAVHEASKEKELQGEKLAHDEKIVEKKANGADKPGTTPSRKGDADKQERALAQLAKALENFTAVMGAKKKRKVVRDDKGNIVELEEETVH